MGHLRVIVGLAIVVVTVTGCAGGATVRLRTDPTGAAAYYRGRLVGETPMEFVVPKAEVTPEIPFRFEKPGYAPADVVMVRRISPGRIMWGIVGTLGMTLIGNGVWSIKPIHPVRMELVSAPTEMPDADRATAEKLQRIQSLRATGAISDAEYQQMRAEALRSGLGLPATR